MKGENLAKIPKGESFHVSFQVVTQDYFVVETKSIESGSLKVDFTVTQFNIFLNNWPCSR